MEEKNDDHAVIVVILAKVIPSTFPIIDLAPQGSFADKENEKEENEEILARCCP